MDEQLLNLFDLFTDRIFRIPGYQKGYVWTEKEVGGFWNDLMRLNAFYRHSVGALKIEPVPEKTYRAWNDDLWLIESKGYTPYYVVDGLQRLITSVLLVKAITNVMKKKNISRLNDASAADISRKFIAEKRGENEPSAYLFGFDADNPCHQYLAKKVFDDSENDLTSLQETTYTANLSNAVAFFEDKMEALSDAELADVYDRITQRFLFKTYEVSSEVGDYRKGCH